MSETQLDDRQVIVKPCGNEWVAYYNNDPTTRCYNRCPNAARRELCERDTQNAVEQREIEQHQQYNTRQFAWAVVLLILFLVVMSSVFINQAIANSVKTHPKKNVHAVKHHHHKSAE